MEIIKPSVEIITPIDGNAILSRIEECGGVCYKSEGRIQDGSAGCASSSREQLENGIGYDG